MEEGIRPLGVAVVGQHNVGKSTIIRKGLHQFGLSKPALLRDTISAYAMRCILDQEPEQVRVLEINSSAFVGPTGRELRWPEELGRIEGAVICYDASDLPSLKGVPELLGTFSVCSRQSIIDSHALCIRRILQQVPCRYCGDGL